MSFYENIRTALGKRDRGYSSVSEMALAQPVGPNGRIVTAGGLRYMIEAGAGLDGLPDNLIPLIYTPEHFGSVGDGVADDTLAIQRMLNYADGKPCHLKDGATYRISGSLTYAGDVNMTCDGTATVYQSGQDFELFEVTGAAPALTTTLDADQEINSHYWSITDSPSSVEAGMLMEVMSSASWYFDPRPASSDARKSELHRVLDIRDGLVVTERPANDGYDISDETVAVRFYPARNVTLRNVKFVLDHVDGQRTRCATIQGASAPIVENCHFINGSEIGIEFDRCYGARMVGGVIQGTNGAGASYALKTLGCTNTHISDTLFYENYAGLDASGGNIISIDTVIEGTTLTGGGYDTDGNRMGWGQYGETGSTQRGHGSHGPSDGLIMRNNTVRHVHSHFVCRGRNVVIENNNMGGRCRFGAIELYDGLGAVIKGNTLDPSFFGGKETLVGAGGNINTRLPDWFVEVQDTWGSDATHPTIISNNRALVQNYFIKVESASPTLMIDGNDISFRPSAGSSDCYVIGSDVSSTLSAFSSLSFDNMPVRTGSGAINIFEGSVSFSKGCRINGWSETVPVSDLSGVFFSGYTLSDAKIMLNGDHAIGTISISGGTVSAAVGSDYSVRFSVPYYLTTPTAVSDVEGAANRVGSAGAVTAYIAATGGVQVTLNNNEKTGTIRAIFRYPLG